MQRRRILVIGGGVAGAACAWGLVGDARRDAASWDVTVLEREALLGAHSTSKNAGILRTLTEDEGVTALALETAEFLAAPAPGFTDVPLVDPVGLVLVGGHFDPGALARWRARKAPGSVVEIPPEELARLAPHYRGARAAAILVRDEGHIDTSALFDGLVRRAREGGASFRTGAAVRELVVEDGRVRGVQLTSGESLEADTVVIAAGGWAEVLGRAAGSRLRLEPRRRHLLVTAPDPAHDARWPVVWSEPDAFYVKPESGGLMLCACDQDVVDPDRCVARPEVRELVAARAAELLEGCEDSRAAHFWAGMRTFCDDAGFALGPDPEVGGLAWAAGLGGHGMSTSIGVGRYLAATLAGEADTELGRHLSPERFVSQRC